MTPVDLQQEIFARLGRLERESAAIRAMLSERCQVRGTSLEDHEARITALEVSEHRRRGGLAVMAALWAAAGILGGVAAKIWGGQ